MLHNLDIQEIVDLSVPLKNLGTTVHPCFPQPRREGFSSIRENGFNSYVWTIVEHAGTHVDAPNHSIEQGATIDQIHLSQYIGPGIVLDFRDKPPKYPIKKDDILTALKTNNDRKLGAGWVTLFLTGYSSKVNTPEWLAHPGLTEEAVNFLVEMGVKAVGIDAPTPDIEIETTYEPAHIIFSSRSIAIYENLTNLSKLLGKRFLFVGCPLPLVGGTGSPVRAIALVTG